MVLHILQTLVTLTKPKSVNVLDGRLIVKILVTKRLGEKPTWLRIPDSKIWGDRPYLFTDNLPIIPPSPPHTHTPPFPDSVPVQCSVTDRCLGHPTGGNENTWNLGPRKYDVAHRELRFSCGKIF